MSMNNMRGLWRGKTTPKCSGEAFNNIWVEGDLIHSKELCYIHPFTNFVKTQNELGRLIVMHEVDPSTLGECTGLRDKNGKLIFEGDIVKVRQDGKQGKANVCFDNGAFTAVPTSGNIYERTLWEYWYNDWDTEVVGNIHDNPELLKGIDDNGQN